jgi:hypothetical protein
MTDMNDKNSAYTSRSRSRSRHDTTRHASPRLGHARACGTPFSFYQLHKWSTVGPPFNYLFISPLSELKMTISDAVRLNKEDVVLSFCRHPWNLSLSEFLWFGYGVQLHYRLYRVDSIVTIILHLSIPEYGYKSIELPSF